MQCELLIQMADPPPVQPLGLRRGLQIAQNQRRHCPLNSAPSIQSPLFTHSIANTAYTVAVFSICCGLIASGGGGGAGDAPSAIGSITRGTGVACVSLLAKSSTPS